MKTTQRPFYRRGGLALLVGAVLMAALAVAAFLLRQNDHGSAERNGVQEAAGGKSRHAATEPGAAESGAQGDFSSRYKRHLSQLYAENGPKPNWMIRELIEYDLYRWLEKGADDEEIRKSLISSLKSYRRRSGKKLEASIERMHEERGYWKYDPNFSEKHNRIDKYLVEQTGVPYIPEGEKTPRAVIEILVEGMDDLTAAKYLLRAPHIFPEAKGEFWNKDEDEYAAEYANRILAEDPSSRDALLVKIISDTDTMETARLLIEHHPTDDYAVRLAAGRLYMDYPEEAAAAILNVLPEEGPHSNSSLHMVLGNAYERLDMLYEAAEQFQMAFAAGSWAGDHRFSKLERGERGLPSIWEERAAAEAPAPAPPLPPAESPAPGVESPPASPHDQPGAPAPPDDPRGIEPPPPPPGAEMDMAAAYADFAKAYQSMFEMEYGLSEATPEGYMNALLEMARAFARAGDAQHAQDAYNAVRKRHSREEVEQVFRRLDERERLKRQPSNDDEEDDDNGEDDS